ncbi:MlaD family protein [Mycobacterium kyorinense]|uniref:MlaD family protein n=2 Tax=Mycobacterium kyorinense TaxID=487514 RepID=UPI002012EAF8|nr:MlaD family protein [Mycobacterium kyorinense]
MIKVNAPVTIAILAIMTVLGAGYMSFGVLHAGPTKHFTHVTLMLHDSGGLLPTSQVTMRGIRVGRVTGIQATHTGLAASLDLDGAYPVPADATITVEPLSVAGEQYVDFKPKVIAPPYLTDGSVIPADRVAPTVTVSELLARFNALLSVVNPADVHTIVTNVAQALTGDDAALDVLGATANSIATYVSENKQLLAALVGNISRLTSGWGEIGLGEALSATGKVLPDAVPAFTRLIQSFDHFSHDGENVFGPGDTANVLVAKLAQYFDMLAPSFSVIFESLQRVSEPVHDYKFHAGYWVDLWESTFNDTGSVRVQVNVPQQQPNDGG